MKRIKAFTLIELLIVVAIIAILAAIAVPNFLEAQVRSKVSRVKSDMRSVTVAIESYSVDHNKPPREMHNGAYGDTLNGSNVFGIVWPGGQQSNGDFTAGLSTPVAYITTAWITDAFVQKGENLPEDEKTFTYQNLFVRQDQTAGPNFSPAFANPAVDFYGAWRMCSIGPDRTFGNDLGSGAPALASQLEYDATNGTVSAGNIWRSQKRNNEQPPIGPLLGAH